MSDKGFGSWVNQKGNVSVCQFKDNILLDSTYPDAPKVQLVHRVCTIFQECWGLRVVCDCHESCTCFKPQIQAVGYGLYRGTNGQGMAQLQHSSLTPQWTLNVGPSLYTPGTQPTSYLTSIFSRVLASSIPWCATYGGQLLLAMAWCQVAVLYGYERKHVSRSMQSTIQRVYGGTTHDSTKIVAYVH